MTLPFTLKTALLTLSVLIVGGGITYAVMNLPETGSEENPTQIFQGALGVAAKTCEQGSNSISLAWLEQPGNAKYVVERSVVNTDSWSTISPDLEGVTAFTDKPPGNAGSAYSYRIKAIMDNGSAYSNRQSVILADCTVAATEQPAETPAAEQPPAGGVQPAPSPEPAPVPPPGPNPTPMPIPQPTPASAPASDIKWGAYLTGSVTVLENLVDDKMDLEAIFLGWEDNGDFPTYKNYLKGQGKIMVIYWEQHGTTLDDIIAGNDDDYIREFAAASKAYGGPIVLAPLHEMNGNWDPWDGPVGNNSPAKVIAAWRHMHGFFAAVPNVQWGWAVNNMSVPDTYENRFEVYYPGDAYVDIVGVDGFAWGDRWETFAQVFDDTLKRLAAYNKPIWIFSTAAAEGSKKAGWITDAITVQMPKYPRLDAFIWFNIDKEWDWRIESDPTSVNAFKNALN